MRIVCLSDTHNRAERMAVPDGDLLLHAGDLTGHGEPAEVARAAQWLARLPHRHKVLVAGNHDFLFQEQPAAARALLAAVPGLTYLQDEAATVAGLRIYGAPWQPWFYNWAFNLPRGGPELQAVWARVPTGIDVLLTHTPPDGILDRNHAGEATGCQALRAELPRIRPRLHVFGHIHEAYGQEARDGTHFVNASSCDLRYRAVQPPIVVDL